MIIDFREQGREDEREGEKHRCERETLIGCLSYPPYWGTNLQPHRESNRDRESNSRPFDLQNDVATS